MRTLERLTACWCPPCNGGDRDGSSTREPQQTPLPTTTTTTAPLGTVLAPSEKAAAAQEQQSLLGAAAAAVHPGAVVLENDGVATTAGRLQGSATTASPSREHEKSGTQPTRPKQQRAAAGRRRRVLLAHQWRSQRTGKALLEELGKAFLVREITPEVWKVIGLWSPRVSTKFFRLIAGCSPHSVNQPLRLVTLLFCSRNGAEKKKNTHTHTRFQSSERPLLSSSRMLGGVFCLGTVHTAVEENY